MTADHGVLTASVFNGLVRNCTGYELVNSWARINLKSCFKAKFKTIEDTNVIDEREAVVDGRGSSDSLMQQ